MRWKSSDSLTRALAGKPIDVAAGLVFRQQKLLITQRPSGKHLAGLWEFPGGKCEPDETFEECVVRELNEELCIEVEVVKFFEEVTHDYIDRIIRLKFFLCLLVKGEPQMVGCSAFKWATKENLVKHAFPPADEKLLRRLVDTPSLWL